MVERVDLDELLKNGAGLPAAPQGPQTPIELTSDRLLIVGILLDDSGSILKSGLEQAIRDGGELALTGLGGVRGSDVYVSIRSFGRRLYDGMLKSAPTGLMGRYRADYTEGTPIVAHSMSMIKELRVLQEEKIGMGINTTLAMGLATDGEPYKDPNEPHEFHALVRESDYITGIGVSRDENDVRKFVNLFQAMGTKQSLTPQSTPQEFRRAMNQFSRSVASIAA